MLTFWHGEKGCTVRATRRNGKVTGEDYINVTFTNVDDGSVHMFFSPHAFRSIFAIEPADLPIGEARIITRYIREG